MNELAMGRRSPGSRVDPDAVGFANVGRLDMDSGGRPFPILHLRRPAPP
jgi:hypothetical protein